MMDGVEGAAAGSFGMVFRGRPRAGFGEDDELDDGGSIARNDSMISIAVKLDFCSGFLNARHNAPTAQHQNVNIRLC